jgi:gluconate 5-dehydrogenase
LAEYGAKIVIADLDQEKAEKAASSVKAKVNSSEAISFKLNVTDEASVASVRDQVVNKFGTVDILVNAHGVNVKKPATEFPVSEWDFIFNINVKGTMLTCREFGKVMVKNKKGKIINLSSVRGVRATAWGGNMAYTATKASVDMITRSLASEWAPYQIHVNAIAPSTVATPFSGATLSDSEKLKRYLSSCPLQRVGQPEDMVGACVFLASPASDFVTGQIIYLDGGLTAIG